jgi:hypothetical protein
MARQSESPYTCGRLLRIHRDGDEVFLTVGSLTQAASQQPWRALRRDDCRPAERPIGLVAAQALR